MTPTIFEKTMNPKYYPFPHEQTAFTIADDQAVIIMADTGQVTVLNEVATRVLAACRWKT